MGAHHVCHTGRLPRTPHSTVVLRAERAIAANRRPLGSLSCLQQWFATEMFVHAGLDQATVCSNHAWQLAMEMVPSSRRDQVGRFNGGQVSLARPEWSFKCLSAGRSWHYNFTSSDTTCVTPSGANNTEGRRPGLQYHFYWWSVLETLLRAASTALSLPADGYISTCKAVDPY